jgi:hypothetical protein
VVSAITDIGSMFFLNFIINFISHILLPILVDAAAAAESIE